VEATNGTTTEDDTPIIAVGDIAILNDEIGTTIGTVTFIASDGKGRTVTFVKEL
jgi:hypothetical protein